MSEKMTPEIRFRGFSDDWEQRKLGDLNKTVRSYSLTRDVETSDITNLRYIHYGDIHKKIANFINAETKLPNIKDGIYEPLSKGDVVVADASEDYLGIAEPSILLIVPSDKIVAGLHTIAIRPTKMSSLYLYYLLHTTDFKRFGSRVGTGLKVFGITKVNLLKYETRFPKLKEQVKIGELLKKIDSTIALHQQKLDQLSKMKISLLQDIFPTDGQNRPKIRFTYFYDIWEKRKLSSKIISELKGKARREMVGNGSEYLDTIHLNGGESQKVNSPSNVTKEDIIILWDGSKAGTIYHGFSGALGSTLKSYKIKGSSSFLYQYLKKYQHLIYENYRTPNIPHVNKNFTNEFYIYETKNEEENKIGKLLNNIDAIVDLHQQKIDKLQQIKKAYLQKMFI
ncbi:restriction endonuclease subunit S [Dellaglioa algida]|uniref:restriction endonuclease subunit S n=1 Tax=Dellaglioa algida TaxID=105612 RepID=UPI0024C49D0A|nr:restriction endonuclease subunit S [Dellaglioa algida]MDK1723201.1 restriction endonuclease subunit S [Dellaglioa algida]MDK1739847.1 restriction endonuclease subunit S [Dellaglioa algida]